MNTRTRFKIRLSRAVTAGVALGAAMLTTSAVQAQYAGQGPTTPEIPATAGVSNVSHRAKDFLSYAQELNQTQIRMADLAQAKAQNPNVKQLAQNLRTASEQNDAQVQALAQNHGVTLGIGRDRTDDRAVSHLRKDNDASFDQQYTEAVIRENVKSIERFRKAAARAEDSDIRQYAQSTLPQLRNNLRQAEDGARSAGVDESTIASLLRGLPAGGEVTVR